MLYHRLANERGHLNFGWLDARHTFSFGSYFDPRHMGFSVLRVINDDVIGEGYGFDTHPHRDMEIITFIKKGALEHEDTLGNKTVIRPGEIQVMSAGTGIRHSEKNPLLDEKTESFQIWIEPNKKGVQPRYEQYGFTDREKRNGLTALISQQGGEGVAAIHADAALDLGNWDEGSDIELVLDPARSYWIQMIEGSIEFDGLKVAAGDGLGLKEMSAFKARAAEKTRVLFFDLP